MKTLYLHIGTEKTATTSIQMFCKKNRALLLDNGLLYPSVLSEEHNNAHFSLVASLLRKFDNNARIEFAGKGVLDFESEWGYLIKQINENPENDILISAEHFSSRLSQEHISKICAFFRENLATHNIKIVINFRAYNELLVSAYSTMLKSGGRKSFGDYFQAIPNKKYYFDYVAIIKNWSEFFGIENLIVDTFDSEYKSDGVVSRFLSSVGQKSIDVVEADYIFNESLSPMTLVYGYKLNEKFHNNPNRKKILKKFSDNTIGVEGDVLSVEQLSIIDICCRNDIQELKELFGKDRIRIKSIKWNNIKNSTCVFDGSEEYLLKVIAGLYS
ncbi:hypothetical protein NBRC116188_18510 [Oceaniserpentilla sp. 4NH20-0058]|uniref:hypothetical protein n=1 Tax=Oceaniserpentilla sp. 4NH20-0058 TaxID=3127660 RepID=UPI0031078746